MKLWLLRPVEELPQDKNPWDPWYDKAFGFVVRAETEQDARNLVVGDLNNQWDGECGNEGKPAWLNPKLSTCVELLQEGEPGLIIKDFASA
jgi:hypothetical protein